MNDKMNERTNNICCVTIAFYKPIYVEADTPQEAADWVKQHLNIFEFDPIYDDGDPELHSYETYTTEAEDYMNEIYLQDGTFMDVDEYMDQLEGGEE